MSNLDHIKSEFSKHPEMYEYLVAFLDLNDIQKDLLNLSNCQTQKEWSKMANSSLCKSGLKYEVYALLGLGICIMGLLLLAASFFLSENVIRGIYNEEIQYVNTNKLRFDWN